jgi:hypothetical protein
MSRVIMETNFGIMSLFWHEIESEMSDFLLQIFQQFLVPGGFVALQKVACKIYFYSKQIVLPILINSLTKLKKLEKHQS